MAERKLLCLSCGAESESFLTECSECGGREYESTKCDGISRAEHDEFETQLAKLSRPVNPLVQA